MAEDNDCAPDPSASAAAAQTSSKSPEKFFGKYRGVVVNNIDPLGESRLLVNVPAIPHALNMWAQACVPYAGLLEGFHVIPAIGSNVWIEFEAGNPSYPLWVGFYWGSALEMTHRKTVNPLAPALAKILKTLCSEFTLDDTPAIGGAKLESLPPAVPVPATLQFDTDGISLTCGLSSITMNPVTGIKISVGLTTSISLAPDGISILAPKISSTATTNVEATAGGEIKQTAATKVSIQAGGAAEIKAGGQADVQAGGTLGVKAAGAASVEAGAALDLKGGVTVGIKAPLVNIN